MTIDMAHDIIDGYDGCGTYPPLTNFTGEQRGGCVYGHVSDDGVFMGRRLNIDLTLDEMHTEGYDRANGEGAAFRVTKTLLAAIEGGLFTPVLGRGDE